MTEITKYRLQIDGSPNGSSQLANQDKIENPTGQKRREIFRMEAKDPQNVYKCCYIK